MLRFTYRSDYHQIPDPSVLFEFTRVTVALFTADPQLTYELLRKDIVPMGQLQNGLYFSFKNDPMKIYKQIREMAEPDESLKLEMSWPIQGMVRVDVANKGNAFYKPKECELTMRCFRGDDSVQS